MKKISGIQKLLTILFIGVIITNTAFPNKIFIQKDNVVVKVVKKSTGLDVGKAD
ncbi:hypothetical protein SAMN02910293_00362 [Streptococcus henryi]|uniref:Uncharacterized protein n=1 Tax=Streptococcus henryi TaxID=439219 RepID=A0A1G6AFX7_9STRE|nr:PhrA family quorum-sensing system peptide [Streptococcus henryi]SDB07295.1 hypothetical protein SAMN02910293_00362 [Streptococcus henryi]